MTTDEIRQMYLKFFESKGHVRIEPAPLVLENDPTTLFTSAGMQSLIPYLKGEPHPKGKRLVDSQPSLRLQDIEEVGDNSHTTFFEMLGNWSLGDYFKKEQLEWCLEFFTKELGLPKEKLWVSVFEGTKEVPKDEESAKRWKELGISEERIFFYGVDRNWWSRSGEPDKMPTGEIGGPDSEIFFDFGIPHNPKFGKECHPNCQCGRFLEIGNSVFIQYQKNEDGSLSELPQKNVDFGGGLERISAAIQDDPDMFKIDVLFPIILRIEEISGRSYSGNERAMRIIADHIRAASFLIVEGITPFKVGHGSVLRRLIRESVDATRSLEINHSIISTFAEKVVEVYKDTYPRIKEYSGKIFQVLSDEEKLYLDTVLSIRVLEKVRVGESLLVKSMTDPVTASGVNAFNSLATLGVPPDISLKNAKELGTIKTSQDEKRWWNIFKDEKEKHRQISRAGAASKFGGGLADHSVQVVKLHTATHLLHAALRKVLGEHVAQKGSNITAERLRFDFSHPQKLSEVEIKKVEDLVNEQIKKGLPVSFETMSLEAAIKKGALHFFGERYGKEVKVYTIGDFSKEVCGGPHVTHIGELGRVRIIKQEKVGAGIVRIYATTEK